MNQIGIIFDCDGTLVNSLVFAVEAFDYALGKIGEKPRPYDEVKRYFGAAADRIFFSLLGDEQKAQVAFEHYLNYQSELALKTQLHVGIRELLDRLGQLKIPMAIVTGRHARDLEIVLKPHRLYEYFIARIADNQLLKSKPAPDGILLAADKMSLPPSSTYYVGDSLTDMQAAHAAGSRPVAALWDPLANHAEMANEKPVLMAHSPSEILSLV